MSVQARPDKRSVRSAGKVNPTPEAQPKLPRYRTIAADLSRRIESQEFVPGSLLPSEAELASQFVVTRMTVRQALAGLAAQGVIERRHGHGTVVAPFKLQRQVQRPVGLAEELLSRGLTPTSVVLDFDEVRPPSDARNDLWIGPAERCTASDGFDTPTVSSSAFRSRSCRRSSRPALATSISRRRA